MGGPVTAIGKPNTDVPEKTVGGKLEVRVSDDDTQQSLEALLREAKETNFHLQMMTENFDINEDIE